MGTTWEVTIWVRRGKGWGTATGQWHEQEVYSGDSALKALWVFWRSRNKSGCVRLVYRGGKHNG